MTGHEILFSRTGKKEDLELWAHHDETKTKAKDSARDLLACLKEDEGYKKARVWCAGDRVYARSKK